MIQHITPEKQASLASSFPSEHNKSFPYPPFHLRANGCPQVRIRWPSGWNELCREWWDGFPVWNHSFPSHWFGPFILAFFFFLRSERICVVPKGFLSAPYGLNVVYVLACCWQLLRTAGVLARICCPAGSAIGYLSSGAAYGRSDAHQHTSWGDDSMILQFNHSS